jgi:hypothetical protein
MISWDFAPLRFQLKAGLIDGRTVVARLNDSGGLVLARMDADVLVVRPTRPPTVAGMPAYYGARPVFRGKVNQEASGDVVLKGVVQHSGLPVLFTVGGGLFAAFGAMIGAAILVSGDLTGLAAILFAAVTGGALLTGTLLLGRLSKVDEQTIMTALRAISVDKQSPQPLTAPEG